MTSSVVQLMNGYYCVILTAILVYKSDSYKKQISENKTTTMLTCIDPGIKSLQLLEDFIIYI